MQHVGGKLLLQVARLLLWWGDRLSLASERTGLWAAALGRRARRLLAMPR